MNQRSPRRGQYVILLMGILIWKHIRMACTRLTNNYTKNALHRFKESAIMVFDADGGKEGRAKGGEDTRKKERVQMPSLRVPGSK